MNKLQCRECVENGQKSVVYPSARTVTCMGWTPYYDEDGFYHSHDPNWHSIRYRCSRGHTWGESRHKQCPVPDCDWGKDDVKLLKSDLIEREAANDAA